MEANRSALTIPLCFMIITEMSHVSRNDEDENVWENIEAGTYIRDVCTRYLTLQICISPSQTSVGLP